MKKRILTGITTTGTPHIGNYIGAIRPALEMAKDSSESFFFLADYHSIIKNNNSEDIKNSVKNIALAWLACGLNPNKTIFYKQSDVPEILELTWILNCVTAKGLMNRAHAYKAAISLNKEDPDKGINMGLFSYPVLMSADILMFDSTHVPVGSDQIQHLEMTRDIAQRFNHLYKPILTIPEPMIQDSENTVPGLDGRKMSKSYNNVIPLLGSEKELRKSVMKIVTNSLEPGEPKDINDCTVFALYEYFASEGQIDDLKKSYKDGISWGDAKGILFELINEELNPIRAKFEELKNNNDYLNDVLYEGAKKARVLAQEKILAIKESSDKNSSEEASVELMLIAFSRMSDEVNALIDARTHEMETARDEARDASDQKTKFFANMSHELRTPLNAILGYGEMLYEDCEDLGYEDLLPDIKKITSAGSHLLSLINNILDLSKIEAGKMELFVTNFEIENMIDTIKDVSAPLASKNDNQFVINFDGAMGAMSQDETKLRQCLTNFLSNAFKFTKNGTVTLDIKSEEVNSVENINFSVTDTGAGMSPEGVAKVFEEYTQAERSTSANYGGTGLGLPISKKFAELMGGDVTVTSEEGVGSVFSIIVPRECPEYEDEVDQGLINIDSDENLVVLVDDDTAMHGLIKRTISKLNLTLLGATNGEKGMDLIREVKPKLILLDVLMPGRDGWSILKECKTDNELKDIPVIMVSQLDQSNMAESLGANEYMTKPIDRELFLNTVKRILGSTTKDKKVLVIDDDKDVRDLMTRLLDDIGVRPIDARDGKEGLERTKDNPSLIVLDLEMPRMDGFEFLDNYIKDTPEDNRAPVLVYSGKDLTDVQSELLKDKVVGLVKKDESSMENLSKTISGLIKES